MRILIAILTLISLLSIFGCGNDSTGPSGNEDYLPMSVGNQWNYTLSGYAVATSADTTYLTGSNVTQIIGTTTHQQGFELYTIQDSTTTIWTNPDTSFTYTETMTVYAHKTDTELRMYDDTTTTDYELFMILPLTLGDTWTPDTTEPTISRTVLSLSASVTVPAGTFASCANLRDTDSVEPGFYFDLFLSKGTGVVEYLITMVDSYGTIHMSYSLTSSIIN